MSVVEAHPPDYLKRISRCGIIQLWVVFEKTLSKYRPVKCFYSACKEDRDENCSEVWAPAVWRERGSADMFRGVVAVVDMVRDTRWILAE
jgi:hypothetical protein